MAKTPKLESVMEEVSKNCLRGQSVPEALRALWAAQLRGKSLIGEPEYGGVELVSDYDEEFFEGYDAGTCGSESVARAYRRMFEQIAFIGREAEEGLIGYWFHGEGVTSADAPIVVLDNEGQFRCTSPSIQDHFVQAAWPDDHGAVAAIRAWFERQGVATLGSPEAVWAAVEGLPDPNERSWRFQREEAERE